MIRDHVAIDAVTHTEIVDGTPTVFVIADDVAVRDSPELLIRTAGWESGFFASAKEFLCQPRCTVPCALIVDLTLPGLIGLET